MKKLSEVMTDMPNTVQEQNGTTSSTAQHGFTIEAGRANGQSKSMNQTKTERAENQRKPQPEDCYEQKTPISKDLEGKRKLTLLVKSCFEALNTYGGGNDVLEASIMLMQLTLGRFDYETVRGAFGIYLQSGADMPKPADIIKIIEPPVKQRDWCKVTFLEILRKKRENVYVTIAEDEYREEFMLAKTTASTDDRLMIKSAIEQNETENKQYWIGD